jgi:organic radical activating enzyme
MNSQTPEHYVDSVELDVHSIFVTIQGEGPFAGQRAVFIRLAGCNLQCPACDTQYTSGRSKRSVAEVCAEVHALTGETAMLVVITGGEPFRQNLTQLCTYLTELGYFVQIETNGTLGIPKQMRPMLTFVPALRTGVYVVCSPKTAIMHQDMHNFACAFKYVMDVDSVSVLDGLPVQALGHPVPANKTVARPIGLKPRSHMVYIQPCDRGNVQANKSNEAICVLSALQYGYTLQLQIHKILGVE